ncbi:hypothetical protein NRB16_22645 [Pseudomonas sp. LJDD11]|uniref:hypothetical protein n=1 Tax=Pseudomonas sp. LJDD11 TaxID=2931984 RepID=UPI00211B7C86|nr:hypothetical protein [Pseudomonas sp. LJDD11]MCQ9426324.1 hypothetical protein [Pseudomonas sp. LJDD11]
MNNSHINKRVRRPKLLKELIIPPPLVPIADPVDGLIKTADLASDITVEFPLWEGARENDTYQLRLNDHTVGIEGLLKPVPPIGTILQLDIPVDTELQADGAYKLDYVVTGFPGGVPDESPATTIIVDRTPPGTHQLGYMDFPAEAKDGLTAEELLNMGDVLTGSIFGYSGLQRGDVIKSYWGEVPGPELILSGEEDENDSIDIGFTKAFLGSLPNPAGATYYTVTDRAGNTSADSKKITIPLFLTEITPDLPAPVIDDNDGLITHIEALNGIEVKIPSSEIIMDGDQIVLHWGSELLGPVPVAPEDLEEPFILIFDVEYRTIEIAGDGAIQLKYEVLREGHPVGISTQLPVNVHITLPVPTPLSSPIIKGASSTPSNEDNFIDENDFELNATIMINWNPGFKASQLITVFWEGVTVLEQPYLITNTDVVAGRPLLLTALNSLFTPVGTGSDIRVNYTVSSSGNPNVSTSETQSIVVQSKDELPGGPDGPAAPEFTAIGDNNTLNRINSINGAPVFIKPYLNIAPGQTVHFIYEAYDSLVGGEVKFEWTHTSAELTENEVQNGYHLLIPRSILNQHCFGHTEAHFKVRSDKGQGNSKKQNSFVDMREFGICPI